jgi:hypothetical protein
MENTMVREPVSVVLADAEVLFAEYDKIVADKLRLEADLRKMCLRFGAASRAWAIRPEHVRNELRRRSAA